MHVRLTKHSESYPDITSPLRAPTLGVMGRSEGGGGAATAEIWQEIKRIKLIRAVAVPIGCRAPNETKREDIFRYQIKICVATTFISKCKT